MTDVGDPACKGGDFFDACGIGETADLRIKSCTLYEESPKIHKHDAKYVQVHGQTAADLLK